MNFRLGVSALFFGLALADPVHAVTLVHTNDLLGEIEPCGCRSNPLGGVVRQANLLKRQKEQNFITVDSGDTFFATQKIPGLLQKQSELQAHYLLTALEMLHYDAIVPGEKDFALGLAPFEKLIRKSSIHFLAANLKRKNGQNLFGSKIILEKFDATGKPIKIGIFGVVSEKLEWPKDLKATSFLASARAQVRQLRKKVDLVVALTHLGLEDDQALANQVPGIDIILGAHTQSFLQTPNHQKNTYIYQSSFRNQYVGMLPLAKPFQNEGYELVGLDAGYDSPQAAPSAMDDWVKSFKTNIAELNSQDGPSTNSPAPKKEAKFQTFPSCAECHLKQFDFWRKTSHSLALRPLIEKEQYKNKECLTCHTVGLGAPGGFTNINALAHYVAKPKVADEEGEKSAKPSGERTLGAPEFSEYLKSLHDAETIRSPVKLGAETDTKPTVRGSLAHLTQAWTPVQCENCHRAGGDHPFSFGYSKKVENQVCLSCHNAERAPEWFKDGKPDLEKIQAKRALVSCPAGEMVLED